MSRTWRHGSRPICINSAAIALRSSAFAVRSRAETVPTRTGGSYWPGTVPMEGGFFRTDTSGICESAGKILVGFFAMTGLFFWAVGRMTWILNAAMPHDILPRVQQPSGDVHCTLRSRYGPAAAFRDVLRMPVGTFSRHPCREKASRKGSTLTLR